MCGSAPKQKESAQERALAERAQARLQEWESDGYKQLEINQLNESKVDLTNTLKGRSNADVEQTAAGSGDVPGAVRLSDAVQSIHSAKRNANMQAVQANQDLQTSTALNGMKTGQDVAAQVDRGVRTAANRGALDARVDLQNKLTLSEAKGKAIATVLQGAAAGGMYNQNPSSLDKTTLSQPTDLGRTTQQTDLSLYNSMA